MKKLQKFNEFLVIVDKITTDKIMELIEKAERTPLSDPDRIAEGKYYREVVSFGESIIPILIERLDYSSIIWFKALRTLTGQNPNKGTNRKTQECIKGWKDWAVKNGYSKK